MNEKEFELVFIIDRSGSMGGLESDIIGGFNTILEKQKELPVDTYVTVVFFNHMLKIARDHVPVKDVEMLTGKDYSAEGCTALLDAVGCMMERSIRLHEGLGDKAPAKTVFVIMTDGCENSSRVYTREHVKGLVEKVKEYGSEVRFTGAGIDSFAEGRSLGVSDEDISSWTHTSDGVREETDYILRSIVKDAEPFLKNMMEQESRVQSSQMKK